MINRRALRLDSIRQFFLDEADEMLSRGFKDQIYDIFKFLPESVQVCLFSATMPGPIITPARTFMKQPPHIRAEGVQGAATHDSTEQFAYRAHALDKLEMVSRILQADGRA